MKTLIIYYSLENHTKFVAQCMAKIYQCDSFELECKKAYPTSKVRKFIWGGKSVVFHELPELKVEHPDFSNYDIICIGTPVWAGCFAPPIRSIAKSLQAKNKNLIFFACHGGGGAEKCFGKMETLLSGNCILKSVAFQDLEDEDKTMQKLHVQFDEILDQR